MRRPEILAPVGDEESLAAALAAGADAVYLGLDEGLNARARATNFPLARLGEVADRVHRAGARLYLTMNTLVFQAELGWVERVLREVAAAGVDALIVQDPAVCLLARAVAPTLELHASTQMTLSSAEGMALARSLGISRVVLPRELSVKEIAALAAATELELEVFVHGALCMSWSGQCLTSEAWGGRSANRGQCAQSCRLPYELVVDGATRPLGDVQYLLSPLDLAGMRAVPELVKIGVSSLKIEGRLKGPAYVAAAVTSYRRWLDHLAAGQITAGAAQASRDLGRMAVTYSRGFGDGFFAGSDHQDLVEGRFPKHRGALLGRVVEVSGSAVRVTAQARSASVAPAVGGGAATGAVSSPLPALGGGADARGLPMVAPEPAPGVGVGFDGGRPEQEEPGGRLFAVERTPDGWWLRFGRPGPDLRRVRPGDRAWMTSDPRVEEEARALVREGTEGRLAAQLTVRGAEGAPLQASLRHGALEVTGEGPPLQPAAGAGLDAAVLREKLGALGGTPFHLAGLEVELPPGLHVPVSALKALRRELVAALEARLLAGARHAVVDGPAAIAPGPLTAWSPPAAPVLIPLVRTAEQLEAVIAVGLDRVELDWMELVGLQAAVDRARAAGLHITLATVRVQKPGEEAWDLRLARLKPDAVLVRHWGALVHFAGRPDRPEVHGDFSLNVTNALTGRHLLGLGADTVTAAHDLDAAQLGALLDALPPERVTVTVHHHIPTFHTEHCVYAHTLSTGRDFRSCGRPCERHRVALRDPKGLEHPVVVDVGCRNTVFHAAAQAAVGEVPGLLRRGVRRLRVELVWETGPQAEQVLRTWQGVIRGNLGRADALRRLGVHEQFGVSAGTMEVVRGG